LKEIIVEDIRDSRRIFERRGSLPNKEHVNWEKEGF
jgi:hypothetical protein